MLLEVWSVHQALSSLLNLSGFLAALASSCPSSVELAGLPVSVFASHHAPVHVTL